MGAPTRHVCPAARAQPPLPAPAEQEQQSVAADAGEALYRIDQQQIAEEARDEQLQALLSREAAELTARLQGQLRNAEALAVSDPDAAEEAQAAVAVLRAKLDEVDNLRTQLEYRLSQRSILSAARAAAAKQEARRRDARQGTQRLDASARTPAARERTQVKREVAKALGAE